MRVLRFIALNMATTEMRWAYPDCLNNIQEDLVYIAPLRLRIKGFSSDVRRPMSDLVRDAGRAMPNGKWIDL